MDQPCFGFIPARYASSRFPGKPLARILGKPMFWHVYTRAKKCPHIQEVYLATDDARIRDEALRLGCNVVLTGVQHTSGTDRVLEAARKVGVFSEAIVVNIQGDEPALHPGMLSDLVAPFSRGETVQVATLVRRIPAKEARDPNRVKAVLTGDGKALYFSRAPVPYSAEQDAEYWGHIGLYAFRYRALEAFSALGASPLETREKLEQLRLLEAGIPIHAAVTEHTSVGVDRPEDIQEVIKLMQENI